MALDSMTLCMWTSNNNAQRDNSEVPLYAKSFDIIHRAEHYTQAIL